MDNHKQLIVHEYSIDFLLEQFEEDGDADVISTKSHINYFKEYFANLGARTVIVEHDYVDKDYLEDFQAYYVRCFAEYKRFCKRLHFFSAQIDESEFINLLLGKKSNLSREALNTNYLGFVVVKPLPSTIIGRTCLKTYPTDGGRNYPIIRPYNVHLFGIQLSVSTLAFQEQDRVAAACATSALWAAFNGTGDIFHHSIPSPVEITKTATRRYSSRNRELPNHGLTIEQMSQAIRDIGLDPSSESAENEFNFLSTVYAYTKARIPVILIFKLIGNLSRRTPIGRRNGDFIGTHAVTIAGFNQGLPEKTAIEGFAFKTVAAGIGKLYAHDDQVGPFARMENDGEVIGYSEDGRRSESYSLSTSWVDSNNQYGNIRAVPQALLIPLDKKIRVPVEHIVLATSKVDYIMSFLQDNVLKRGKESGFTWDIHLTTVGDLKKLIIEDPSYIGEEIPRTDFLLKSLPKYIWIAKCSNDDNRVLDLLFDATDFEHGKFFLQALVHDIELGNMLKDLILANPDAAKEFGPTPAGAIVKWFRTYLTSTAL